MTGYLRIAATVLPLVAVVATAGAQVPKLPDHPAPSGANDRAHHPGSLSDQNAKQEPTAKTTPDTPPGVFVEGALSVPGAPDDTQTRPAKFSARNDAADKIPLMARGPQLSDDQKQQILDAVRQARVSSANVEAVPTTELGSDVELREWPVGLTRAVPAVKDTKYVLAGDKILIVLPSNRIVVGEIVP
jgi:hypothetical protein